MLDKLALLVLICAAIVSSSFMQFYADDGRLGKATKLHKALKVLIPRSITNNSKGYTMALNAAAV